MKLKTNRLLRIKRGYYVTRQAYPLWDPCAHALEIAFSNDTHPPHEHASVSFKQGGTFFRYPGEAVQYAIKERAAWAADLEGEDAGLLPGFTLACDGALLQQTEEELLAWAHERWNGPQEAEPPSPEEQARREANAKEWADTLAKWKDIIERHSDLMTFEEEPDYDFDYQDLARQALDTASCEEEAEETYDELVALCDQEGVYCLRGYLTLPGQRRKCVDILRGVHGPVDPVNWLGVWQETYLKLETWFAEQAQEMAGRATYAAGGAL